MMDQSNVQVLELATVDNERVVYGSNAYSIPRTTWDSAGRPMRAIVIFASAQVESVKEAIDAAAALFPDEEESE